MYVYIIHFFCLSACLEIDVFELILLRDSPLSKVDENLSLFLNRIKMNINDNGLSDIICCSQYILPNKNLNRRHKLQR